VESFSFGKAPIAIEQRRPDGKISPNPNLVEDFLSGKESLQIDWPAV
jgi:hypothetical protein